MLDACGRGANAEIALLRAAGPLPREYALLDQPEGPEPWQPWDSISLLRHDDGGQHRFVPPPGTYGKRWVAALADLGPSIGALMAPVKPDATGGGSNS